MTTPGHSTGRELHASGLAARSAVSRLDAPALDELHADLERGRGAPVRRTIWAVDAFDIIKYCFPLSPRRSRIVPFDLEVTADEHAAVSHILNETGLPPVLLPEYLGELLAFATDMVKDLAGPHARRELDLTLRKELGDLVERAIEYEASGLAPVEEGFAAAVLYFSNEVLGLGLKRLHDLSARVLRPLTGPFPGLDAASTDRLERWNTGFRANDQFFAACERAFSEIFPSRHPASSEGSNRLRDRADSISLDRVVQANRELRALHGGAADGWRVHLLSSSRRVISLVRRLQSMSPSLGVTPRDLAVVRSPAQVSALLTFRQLIESHDEAEGVSRDTRLQQVLDGITWRASTLCEACVLHGHSNSDCVHRDQCQLVHEQSPQVGDTRFQAAENLALFVRRRDRLRKSLAQRSPDNAVLGWIHDTVNDDDLQRESWARLDALRGAIRVASYLALQGTSAEGERHRNLDSDRDWARSFSTVVPWLIDVQDPQLHALIVECKRAFLHANGNSAGDREVLRSAFTRLLAAEPAELRDSPLTIEWHLATAVILLVIGATSSDDLAAYLCDRLLRLTVDDVAPYRRRRDVLYVASWTKRRVGDYAAALALAEEGLNLMPTDPRLVHGSAMAFRGMVRATPRRLLVEDDWRDARQQKAIELYEEAAAGFAESQTLPKEDSLMLQSVCLNQLAYNCALSGRFSPGGRGVLRARTALVTLKSLTEVSRWEAFPEFFHTEALVEVKEALALVGEARRKKLGYANEAIGKAILYGPTRKDYRSLEIEIAELMKTT